MTKLMISSWWPSIETFPAFFNTSNMVAPNSTPAASRDHKDTEFEIDVSEPDVSHGSRGCHPGHLAEIRSTAIL